MIKIIDPKTKITIIRRIRIEIMKPEKKEEKNEHE